MFSKNFTKSGYDWGYGNFPFPIIKRKAFINLGKKLLIVQICTYLLTGVSIYWKFNESLGSGCLTEIAKECVCVYSFFLFAGSYNYYLLFLLSRLETIRAWQRYNCNINHCTYYLFQGYFGPPLKISKIPFLFLSRSSISREFHNSLHFPLSHINDPDSLENIILFLDFSTIFVSNPKCNKKKELETGKGKEMWH